MPNTFKSKLSSYFFNSFSKKSFEKISDVEGKEEAYFRDGKIVVLVKDKELGGQIYYIVKSLAEWDNEVSTSSMSFKIENYLADKQNRVETIWINVTAERKWGEFSRVERLQELISFVNAMEDAGYILNDSKFENEYCTCISSLLSFFSIGGEQLQKSKGCLIRYIHYVYSDGGNFDEFYKEVHRNQLCQLSSVFPYNLPLIKMCYNYFVEGTVPDDISAVLATEEKDLVHRARYYFSYWIAMNRDLTSSHTLTEKNDIYSIYDGKIKIYHTVSEDFERFLRDDECLIGSAMTSTLEQFNETIVDCDGKIIGYKFSTQELQDKHCITEKTFSTQHEILSFMGNISKFLLNINDRVYFRNCEENNFDVQSSLFYGRSWAKLVFKIATVKDYYDLVTMDEDALKHQIISMLFKVYLDYVTKKYGKISDEAELFSKDEVRFLSPLVAKEFINYALEKDTDYNLITSEVFDFLYSWIEVSKNDLAYDSRFKYDPARVSIVFDYECEARYGIQIKAGMNETLSDGRNLITFKKKKKISSLKSEEDSLREEINEKLGNIEDTHVEILGVSEVIYSKTLDADNMYKAVGYVTGKIKGRRLTDEVLLGLDNRALLKVLGYYFAKFQDYYFIPWESVYMDDDYHFYINIFDKNFQLKYSRGWYHKGEFLEYIVNHLIDIGYNPNAFVGLNIQNYIHGYSRARLISLAESYNAYCDEHGIYYSSKDGICPVCSKAKWFMHDNFLENNSVLFEDSYARHFTIDSQYNLKLYNPSCVNMKEMENAVDKIVGKRLSSIEIVAGQDCFIPCKKAINSDGKFVGYIYEAIKVVPSSWNSSELCIDLKNQKELKNLPRLMSLIRLILQVKELTAKKYGFIKNPFSQVFLNKAHKKQVQILNIDFLKKGNATLTIKWLCEYVCEVLESDKTIEIDVSDCTNNVDKLLARLQSQSKVMTKYCAIHNAYYNKDYMFCPMCISPAQLGNVEIEHWRKSVFDEKKYENKGGESFIYSYSDDSVAKVFNDQIDKDFKNAILAKVLSKKSLLDEINRKGFKYRYIIPQKLLVDQDTDQIFGYVMEKVVNAKPLSILKDTEEVEKLGFSRQDVLEILITVGEGIETLHSKVNMYIGDLNGRNILFDTEKNVYFLDFDGMGVDGLAPVFCTVGYIDPVSQKNHNITMKDDWYSFAIQAFYYLTFTHPFNGIYYDTVNGRKVNLEVPDKMERKISLLGNHGIKVPDVAVPWNWMSSELKTAFLKIFEGDDRQSIVPLLIRQYKNDFGNDFHDEINNIIRVNSKFIATKANIFDGEVVAVINHFSAVCKNNNDQLEVVIKNYIQGCTNNIQVPACFGIQNILLSEDGKIAFVVYNKKVIAIDLKVNTEIYSKDISDRRDVVVNGNTLYCTGVSEGKELIFQTTFSPDGEVVKERIKFLPDQKTKRFFAKFNSKFVIVKQSANNRNVDEIYCNSVKLCDIYHRSEYSEYVIAYDEVTKKWLVVNSEGNGIVINGTNGNFKDITFAEGINDDNIGNIIFHKGSVYVPNYDTLYIINTNKDQITAKKMECHKIMTSHSRLYDINASGFSVIADTDFYEVRKG